MRNAQVQANLLALNAAIDAAGLSHSTALAAEQSSVASAHLRGLSKQLDGLLRQFKV